MTVAMNFCYYDEGAYDVGDGVMMPLDEYTKNFWIIVYFLFF